MTSHRRLLVVDDDVGLADLVATVAADLGYVTRVETSGRAFMDAFAAFRPTAVFTDVYLPDVDGIDLSKWLMKNAFSGTLVVCSGSPTYLETVDLYVEPSALESYTKLTKPVAIADLRAALL